MVKGEKVTLTNRVKRFVRRLSDGLGDNTLERYGDKVSAINALEPELQQNSDEQLRQRAAALRECAFGIS